MASTGIAAASASNPASLAVTTGIQGVSSLISLVGKLNKPFGTCAPNAPDSESFLSCWKHAIPDNQIPYFKGPPNARQPGTSGWDFAICIGARGGRAPVTGCGGGCDCSSAPCVCAPTGAAYGNRDGSFSYPDNSNAGGASLTPSSQAVNEVSQVAKSNKGAIAAIGVLGLGAVALFFIA